MPLEVPSEHFVGKVSQRAVVWHNGRVLLTRDAGAEKWGVPGGRLHMDEDAQAGLIREVKEELGIDVRIRNILHTEVEQYSDGTSVYVVYYAADLIEPTQEMALDATEVAEAKWYSEDEYRGEVIILWPSTKKALSLSKPQ